MRFYFKYLLNYSLLSSGTNPCGLTKGKEDILHGFETPM